MKNNVVLKKEIIYRSQHRGTKEMDLIIGNFVMRYIDDLNFNDLKDLEHFLQIEDEILRIAEPTVSGTSNNKLTVIRGALATKVSDHCGEGAILTRRGSFSWPGHSGEGLSYFKQIIRY